MSFAPQNAKMTALLELKRVVKQLSIVFIHVVLVADVGSCRHNCVHYGYDLLLILLLEHSESIETVVSVSLEFDRVPREVFLQALTQSLLIVADLLRRVKHRLFSLKLTKFLTHFCGKIRVFSQIKSINYY